MPKRGHYQTRVILLTQQLNYAITCIQFNFQLKYSCILLITNGPPPWWEAQVVHIIHMD